MEQNLEIKIKLKSDNGFDVEFYEPESGDFGRVHCTDSGFADLEKWQTENNQLACEIRSWIDILRDREEYEKENEKKTYYVTVEKKKYEYLTVDAADVDEAVDKMNKWVDAEDKDFSYDFAICDAVGETLVDWKN